MIDRKKPLFVQWCAKDALDGMQALTPMEELAYRRLIDLIYATEDNLPDDDKRLAWMTKVGRRWPGIKRALIAQNKIDVVDGRVTIRRCRDELFKAEKNIAQKRAARAARGDLSTSFGAQKIAKDVTPKMRESDDDKALKTNDTDATAATTGVTTAVPLDEPTNRKLYKQDSTSPTDSPNGESYGEVVGDGSPTLPSSPPEIDLRQTVLSPMAKAWNEICGVVGLTRIREAKGQRRAKMLKRHREDFKGDIGRWRAYCQAIAASSFLTGDNDRGWKADFDWALEPRNLTKVRENTYTNRGKPGDDTPRRHF